MKPTVGRIVHYGATDKPKAAIVTRVWGDTNTVNLFVMNDGSDETGTFTTTSITMGTDSFQWRWPVREEATPGQ